MIGPYDRQLFRALGEAPAGLTVRELSVALGINRQTLYRRVKRLEAAGSIAIKPRSDGPNVIALAPGFALDHDEHDVDHERSIDPKPFTSTPEPMEPAIFSACLAFLAGNASEKRKATILANPHFKATK